MLNNKVKQNRRSRLPFKLVLSHDTQDEQEKGDS